MTACAVASLSGLPMRLPAWWRALALAVLGVLLGGSFTASTLQSLPDWWRTISLMLLLSGFYLLFSNLDRKSTRLNSSHVAISYAVFCLKKKKNNDTIETQ